MEIAAPKGALQGKRMNKNCLRVVEGLCDSNLNFMRLPKGSVTVVIISGNKVCKWDPMILLL
jgi:hypothetical protein